MREEADIAIVDYGSGNLRSVQKAFEAAGARAVVTDRPRVVSRARAVVVPGVGAFGAAARELRRRGLWGPVREAATDGRPFLGICMGLQLLFMRSEESPGVRGLGVFPGRVRRFRPDVAGGGLPVPHMGWNEVHVDNGQGTPLRGIPDGARFYFVHSYYVDPDDASLAVASTGYGRPFVSAVARGGLFACQFHPEKSQRMGIQLLRNFLRGAGWN